MCTVQIIDHPADIGIHVKAKSLGGLFQASANAMFSVIADLSTVNPNISVPVSLSNPNLDNLLIDWLNELLYLFEVQDIIFCTFHIETITETSIIANAFGEKLDIRKHIILTEVKAATYHQLDVSQKDDGWQAQVIFDL